jgi:uncharacterized protein (TIGR02270 family)
MSAVPSRVLSQLTAGAPFAFYRRSLAIDSPRYNLVTLSHLDERLDGMLTALAEIPPAELGPALDTKTAGAASVLTFLAALQNNSSQVRALAEAASASKRHRTEFLAAMEWLEPAYAQPFAKSLFESSDPAVSELGLAAHIFHNLIPSRDIEKALTHTQASLRATAVRVISQLGLLSLRDRGAASLEDEDDTVRFHAAAMLARCGATPSCIQVLQQFVETPGHFSEPAAFILGMVMPSSEWVSWANPLARSTDHELFILRSAIGQGDSRVVPWFIEIMANSKLSHLAAEAFSTFTGLNIANEHFDLPSVKGKAGNELDNLPEPDIAKISNWWQIHQQEFPSGTRYFFGQPVTLEGLHHALVTANQRQRIWASQLLGALYPNKAIFRVSAPAFRQKIRLGVAQ